MTSPPRTATPCSSSRPKASTRRPSGNSGERCPARPAWRRRRRCHGTGFIPDSRTARCQSAAGLPLAVITNPEPNAGAGTSNIVLSANRRGMVHLELDFESDGWSATYKFDSAGQQRPYRAGVKGSHRSQPGATMDAGYSRWAYVLASAITSVSLPRRSPGLPPGPSSTPAVGA